MTRQIQIHGQRINLYRVRGYDNAWCSDPRLALRIQRKRQQLLRELRSTAQDLQAVAEKS
ncbi:MAG: hypothetical protein ACE5JU_07485 [Candidatus Binatia bacterium]